MHATFIVIERKQMTNVYLASANEISRGDSGILEYINFFRGKKSLLCKMNRFRTLNVRSVFIVSFSQEVEEQRLIFTLNL